VGCLQIPLYVADPAADGWPNFLEGTAEHPPLGANIINAAAECLEYRTVACKLRQSRQGCGHFAVFMVEWMPVKL
jgi:hypothetical protein